MRCVLCVNVNASTVVMQVYESHAGRIVYKSIFTASTQGRRHVFQVGGENQSRAERAKKFFGLSPQEQRFGGDKIYYCQYFRRQLQMKVSRLIGQALYRPSNYKSESVIS